MPLHFDNSEESFIREVKQVIEANIEDPRFSIEQLCKAVGVSRTQLHRKIKDSTGLSTSLYIRRLRMEKARDLLDSTPLNISEIAYQTGNTSPQNFSKYFSEAFGLSPSAYRKKAHERLRTHSQSAPQESEEPPTSPSPRPDEQATTAHRIWIGALLLIGLLVLLALLLRPFSSSTDTVAPTVPSIAVIPFQNLGGPENEFFCEGVVEDILTQLTKFKGLRIISRTSSSQFKQTKKSIRQIAAELDVEYILEGSVRQSGQKLRITAQLIRASDDQHVWAQNYDRDKANIMDIQSEVAQDIARALNQEISPGIKEEIEKKQTENIEAYNALLRGRYLMRSRTREGIEESIIQFDQALQLDPHYSEAYAGKAVSYHLLINLQYSPHMRREYLEIAEENALFAIKEDINNALAYAILGNIYRSLYRWNESMTAYEIALDINPNDALTNYWYALLLRALGQFDQSINYHQKAARLDPIYPVIHAGYAYTCVVAGQFERAEILLNKGESLFKNSFLFVFVRGALELSKGHFEEAVNQYRRALELNPAYPPAVTAIIFCQGKMAQAKPVMDYLATLDTNRVSDCLQAAYAYAGLGDVEQSLRYLKEAAEKGRIPEDMLVHPYFKDFRQHPDFLEILEQFGHSKYLQ